MRDIVDKKIAVLCDTVGKVQAMINVLKHKDCDTTSAERYEEYGENTCQSMRTGGWSMRTGWCGDTLCFGSKKWYEDNGYAIITFDEFMEDEPLTTYQMVTLADVNGKTYGTGDMYYSKETGFVDKAGVVWDLCAFESYSNPFSEFIHLSGWKEVSEKEMTKEEIEKKLGYKIKIVD